MKMFYQIWIFAIRQWVRKVDWHCKKTILQIKQIYEFDKKKGDERINKGNDKKPTKNILKNIIVKSNIQQ